MKINFFVRLANAIGASRVVIKDKNNSMQVVFNGNIEQDVRQPIGAEGDNSDEAYIEYSINGANPKAHGFIKAGETVDIY
ncbi:hypothetical protein ACT2FY_39110 [Paraburkholderia fungorum]|uniref:hypothetical protein n=1 Tax=Paraburkholderia fungorum TaxID=134537 RepID=UPI00402BD0D8